MKAGTLLVATLPVTSILRLIESSIPDSGLPSAVRCPKEKARRSTLEGALFLIRRLRKRRQETLRSTRTVALASALLLASSALAASASAAA